MASPATKRTVLIAGVVVMVGIVVAAVLTLSNRGGPAAETPAAEQTTPTPTAPDPRTAAQQYLTAFASGDSASAGGLTDDPTAASSALAGARTALRPTEVQTTLTSVTAPTGNSATAAFTATWLFPAGHVWTYHGSLQVTASGANWRVHWTPATLYPTLQAGQRLALVTSAPDQPAVVDRDGKPLVLTGSGGTKLADPNDFALFQAPLTGRVPAASGVFAVERVDASGTNLETLVGSTGTQTKPFQSTLSVAVQSAAQSAVNGYAGKAVIVAMQPSDGSILAVARNAQSADSSPFSGLYPPGSTFKIVTATAVLEAGTANPGTAVNCPLTEQIGTRTLTNEGFALGATTMLQAFAKSCNTTFGQLASQLPPTGLSTVASQYGLGADFTIPGVPTQTGKVVPAANADEQVEDGIGQGTVLVSPFGGALMAATVAAGHAVTPRLWLDQDTTVNTGYTAPPAGVLAPLRTMMRAVVTDGTGTAAANSGVVYGKTGTAQFGSGTQSHGWFVGYRGDLAFAVFLEGAGDSKPAVALAATFLAGVN